MDAVCGGGNGDSPGGKGYDRRAHPDQRGKVYIDGGKLYVDQAFVNSLFAQDITATGTISGLKLRGESIDIKARMKPMAQPHL